MRTSASSQFAWSLDGKQDSEAVAKVGNNATFDQPYDYAAITDLYFVSAFLPDAPERTTVVTLHNTIDLPSNLSDPNSEKKPAHVLGLAVGDTSGVTRLRLYAGPKAMDVLDLDSRHRPRRQAHRAIARAADPVRLADHHRQASLSGPALPGRCTASTTGAGPSSSSP